MTRVARLAATVLAVFLLPALASADTAPMASAPLPPPYVPPLPREKPTLPASPAVRHLVPQPKAQPTEELAKVPRPQQKPQPPPEASLASGRPLPPAWRQVRRRMPPWFAVGAPQYRRFASSTPPYGPPPPYRYYRDGPYAYGPPYGYSPPYGPGSWR
ncbi:MAG TPA: hypothetical protein VGR91_09465 [Stellaceae bacterium]|nr:hypothetical protein [Stellaceae bacterium]